jgi:uncharacterized protein (TIGR02646 family)
MNATLLSAFHGKCGYCECIEAETIDHFWPQDSNIDKIWDWDNYIWSCYPCQQRKSHRLPVSDTGYQMVNPREDEPLHYLRIDPVTGKILAISASDAIEQRGAYTISILELDQRPDLDEARRLLYKLVVYLLYRIVHPQSSQKEIIEAWRLMREVLDARQPYLAIIQQLFTLPSPDVEPLVQQLFEVIPDAQVFLERFQRPIL